jgi:hypothetical protein
MCQNGDFSIFLGLLKTSICAMRKKIKNATMPRRSTYRQGANLSLAPVRNRPYFHSELLPSRLTKRPTMRIWNYLLSVLGITKRSRSHRRTLERLKKSPPHAA